VINIDKFWMQGDLNPVVKSKFILVTLTLLVILLVHLVLLNLLNRSRFSFRLGIVNMQYTVWLLGDPLIMFILIGNVVATKHVLINISTSAKSKHSRPSPSLTTALTTTDGRNPLITDDVTRGSITIIKLSSTMY